VATNGLSEVMQKVALLDRARRSSTQKPGGGNFARVAAIAEADLAPLNSGPDSALRDIVRGFDTRMVNEGEKPLGVGEKEDCQRAHCGVLAVEVPLAQRKELFLDRHRLGDELAPVDRASAVAMPEPEQPGMEGQRVPGEMVRVGGFAQLPDTEDVPLQMGPTELSDPLVVLDIGAEAVAAQDAGEGRPQELLKDLGAAAAGDYEQGEGSGDQNPEPAFLPVLAPARFVTVEDRFVPKLLLDFLTRGLQGLAGFLDVLLGAAESDQNAQGTFQQLLDLPPRHPAEYGQVRDKGHEPWAGSASNLRRNRHPVRCSTAAGDQAELVLGSLGFDLGQFGDLMAVDIAFQSRPLLLFREPALAAAAAFREHWNHPRDLLDRNQGPAPSRVSRLTAGFALAFRALRVRAFAGRGADGGSFGGTKREARQLIAPSSATAGVPC